MDETSTVSERDARVDMLIRWLSLGSCETTLVGDEFRRGISGGQRKRLSIGVEIISLPNILFLDEPTSGLDSETAFECMDAVRDITDQSRTTMVTIHQPSPETFALFDTLLLLSSGRVTYFGPMEECVSYFTSLQYKYLPGQNPADFVVLVGGGKFAPENAAQPMNAEALSEIYEVSDARDRLTIALDNAPRDVSPSHGYTQRYPTGTLTQMGTLLVRGYMEKSRDSRGVTTSFARAIVIGLFMGSLFYQQDTCGELIEARFGMPPYYTKGQKFSSACYNNMTGIPDITSVSCTDCTEAVFNRFSILFFSLLFLMMSNLQANLEILRSRSQKDLCSLLL